MLENNFRFYDHEDRGDPWRSIDLQAYRADEDPGALSRLHRVLGFLAARGGIHRGILRLYESRGDLTVTWRIEPRPNEVEEVEAAWTSDIGESGQAQIFHEF